MIIECINCHKKFKVDSNLIPDAGREIECGSCNHVWFFNTINQEYTKNQEPISQISAIKSEEINVSNNQEIGSINSNEPEVIENKNKFKNLKKSNSTLGTFVSLTLVLIISFVALIIILDTFKQPLYNNFPELEVIMFNLYETIIDISLFIKDLI
tara:strand:+ start:54 stop:518 length:465 start_codon:yes stop_codon:yes gene_type:complete